MATKKAKQSSAGKPHPFGLHGQAIANAVKLIPTHKRTDTHHFSLTNAGALLVVCQKSRSSMVGSFTGAAASALASPPAQDKAKGTVSASSHENAPSAGAERLTV